MKIACFFFQMPSWKYTRASCVYYMGLIASYLLAKKLNTIFLPKMLQLEINDYYSTFPDDIALSILRTCACFSVTSVSRVASTAV